LVLLDKTKLWASASFVAAPEKTGFQLSSAFSNVDDFRDFSLEVKTR